MIYHFPKVVRIEPASKCNLACSHCPTGTIDMDRGLMKEDVFNSILKELKIHKDQIKVIVLYHGGEPLLNKNFFSMLSSIRKISNNFSIKTVSNGMALNQGNILKIIKSELNEIEISLDGETANESEEVRIKSKTEKIVLNIQKLLQEKKNHNALIKISIATTQFMRTLSDLDRVDEITKTIPKWLRDNFHDDVSYNPCVAMRWPHMQVNKPYELGWGTGEDKDNCNHTTDTVTIRADGSIVPCCFDLTSELIMGNILFQPLSDIYNGSRYLQLRKSIAEKKFESICNNCNTVRPPVYLIKPV